MKVSLNWVRYLNDKYQCAAEPAPNGIEELVEKIGAQLGAVEETIDLGKKYQGIVIAKIISFQKHPNADKLSVCLIDDGKVVKGVKRDKNGLIEIVCGAPNVREGVLAAWIPPGHIVPSTLNKEPMVLEAREIRGVVSNGMLASAKELNLGDDHSGIVEIDQDLNPGTSFASTFGLDDYVIDIENKMFTHRPDLFGILGVARELAGIQHHAFKSPKWYDENADVVYKNGPTTHNLDVKNEVPNLVPRFCVVVIKDIKVAQSSLFIKTKLASVGIRPINNIVDITNFIMHETAQPLHAFDYDKVKTGLLGLRLGKKGEKLKIIGGKVIDLKETDVVITDGTKPISLGGIMGGASTEVDESTKTVILECANFNLNSTRRSAVGHGLFTDAATRFTKNQSPRQNRAVIAKATDDILKIVGGRVASGLIDDKHFVVNEKPIQISPEFINSRLGLDLSAKEVEKLLQNVEFNVRPNGGKLSIIQPFWRTDIEIPEDIVEEVGRLYGYDHLPKQLPQRDLTPVARNKTLDLKQRARGLLSSAGANEVLTYSFVHGKLLKAADQDESLAFKIANALSPDLQYYRLSLTPSLLGKVHQNIKSGFTKFAIYEIGKVYSKAEVEKGLPKEFDRLALVFASDEKNQKTANTFYQAKKYLSYLLEKFGLETEYRPLATTTIEAGKMGLQMTRPFDPLRAAVVYVDSGPVGVVGEFKESTKHMLKLPSKIAGFELFLSSIGWPSKGYKALNKFPALEQDITLRSDKKITYAGLTNFLSSQLQKLSKNHGYLYELSPIDIFQKAGDEEYKQTTWRITLQHPERTLTTIEANNLLDELAKAAKEKFKAERI